MFFGDGVVADFPFIAVAKYEKLKNTQTSQFLEHPL